MGTPYLAEIRIFSFNYPPKGWALCNGQLLAINQNQALFALLGTTYGGDGRTTFALPNMQGNFPLHAGTSPVGASFVLGQTGGEISHTLITNEMPAHTHTPVASSTPANLGVPTGSLWATGNAAYNPTANTTMNPAGILAAGSGQAHENRPPFLVLNFCIALSGIFPSPN
jgi:microcystin-dependent protein